MLEHLKICFFKPIMIGKYMGQKVYKTLLIHLLLALIALVPFVISKSLDTKLSYDSYNTARDAFMKSDESYTFKLENYKMNANKTFYYAGYEADVYFIGPDYNSLNGYLFSFTTPSLIFTTDGVTLLLANFVLYEASYEEMGIKDIDCAKIKNYDFAELDKYYDLLQVVYQSTHVKSVILYSIFAYLSMVIEVLMFGVLMGFLSFISKPIIPFKVRFKMSLDALMIVYFGYLVGYLTGISWVSIVTVVIAYIFLLISFKAIVPIKINPNVNNNSN